MASLKNCPSCGKLYLETGRKVCPACVEAEEEMENVVRNFVRDHKKATIHEIVQGTGVKERIVIRMIKAGRFIETSIKIEYPCEKCGHMITRGKLCEKCSNDLVQQVAKAAANANRRLERSDRSHTLNMMKNR